MDTITDKATIHQFRVARARIESMSLVHERLYESDNVAKVDIRLYLSEIIGKLADAYSSSTNF